MYVEAARKDLWPGDATVEDGAPSLYEYRPSAGAEPVLVGVSNAGPLHGSPVNAEAHLISECGTTFNAISAGGEVLDFAALPAGAEVGGSLYCTEKDGVGEGTGPAVTELYARIGGSQTVKVSRGRASAVFDGASEDGSRELFTEGGELLAYDRNAPEGAKLTLITSSPATVAAVSGDGSRVYFNSPAALTSSANGNGETAGDVPGEKLYVYDTQTGGTAFVAGEATGAETTRDGAFLLFNSTRDLVGTDDRSTVSQLFEYDAETGRVERVSAGQKAPAGYLCGSTGRVEAGYGCDGNTDDGIATPVVPNRPAVLTTGPTASDTFRGVAEDGTVVFGSPLALTPNAVPGIPYLPPEATHLKRGTEDIYEFKAGQVYLISAADEATPTHEVRGEGIDRAGNDVLFTTSDMLVPQATGTQVGLLAARREGGFPAPAGPTECSLETCQGPLAAAPGLAAPVQASLDTPEPPAGPPPPAAPKAKPKPKPTVRPCRRGYVRRKGKCVRRRARKAGLARNDQRTKR
jgi:hypothetical protein